VTQTLQSVGAINRHKEANNLVIIPGVLDIDNTGENTAENSDVK